MANICGNHLIITGEGSSLDAFYTRLTGQDKALLKTVPNFEINEKSDYCIYGKDSIGQDDDGNIEISFGSQWSCPIEEIAELSSEYPDLIFDLVYEEGGNDAYGEVHIQDGGYNETELEADEYFLKYNEDYKAAYRRIKFSTYKSFVKNYSGRNFFEEYPFSYLDKQVLDRIKDDDLPMFINRQWMDEDVEEAYKRRLAGVAPEDISIDRYGDKGILFLDEINRANREVQQATFELVEALWK